MLEDYTAIREIIVKGREERHALFNLISGAFIRRTVNIARANSILASKGELTRIKISLASSIVRLRDINSDDKTIKNYADEAVRIFSNELSSINAIIAEFSNKAGNLKQIDADWAVRNLQIDLLNTQADILIKDLQEENLVIQKIDRKLAEIYRAKVA